MTGSKRHPIKDRGNDLYETPAVATEALLHVEKLPKWIWEPACGRGAIVKVLIAAGHHVIATDIQAPAGIRDRPSYRIDFLVTKNPPPHTRAIVTNPPYQLADQFVAHAMNICPLNFFLLRLAFLEGLRRSPILDSGHLARVHVFANRLPMMHRDGWTGPKSTSSVAYAWFVFDTRGRSLTVIDRIIWGNP